MKLLNLIASRMAIYALCAGCVATPLGANSMDTYNLSFERDEPGAQGPPISWTFPGVDRITCEIQQESVDADTGEQCLMVDYSNAEEGDYGRTFFSDFIQIDPKATYVQSVWLKTEGRTTAGFGVAVGRIYYDKDQKEIPVATAHDRYMIVNVGNQEWEKYEAELTPSDSEEVTPQTIPSHAHSVRLIFLSYRYDRKYWIDDHRFEPVRKTIGQPGSSATKIVPAVEAKTPVAINGDLSDAIWQESDFQTGFVRSIVDKTLSSPVDHQTGFKVAFDRQNLYIAVQCSSPENADLRVQKRERNDMGIFADECIELFIDATGTRKNVIQIGINPNGAITEMFYSLQNLGTEVATRQTEAEWTAELKIPRNAIRQLLHIDGLEPNDDFWNINLCRHQPGGKAEERFSSWSFTRSAFNTPSAMGLLLFKDKKTVLQNRLIATETLLQQRLKEHKELLTTGPIAAVNQKVEGIRSIADFLENLKAEQQRVDEVPNHLFVRYFNELGAVPGTVDAMIAEVKRMKFFFPAEREDAGYIIYSTPLLSSTDAGAFPEETASTGHRIRAAGNEISSTRISLFTKKRLEEVSYTLAPVTSEAGATLPTETIDIRVLKPWGSDKQACILVTDTRVELKGWLENYDQHPRFVEAIPENSSEHFLVRFDATGVKPGRYRTTVTISPRNGESSDFPVEIEVLPFELRKTDRDVGFFYHGVLQQKDGPPIGSTGAFFYNGLTTEESMEEEFRDLARAGFNFLVVPAYAAGPLNPDYVETIARIAGHAGIRKVALTGAEHLINAGVAEKGGETLLNARKTLSERIAGMAGVGDRHGVELYVYGVDEPNSDAQIEACNAIFEVAQENGFGGMTAVMSDEVRARMKGLDILTMNWNIMTLNNSPLLEGLKNEVNYPFKSIAYYGNLYAKYLPAVRLTSGWYLYKSRFNGSIPWAYYCLGKNWDPFEDWGIGLSIGVAYYAFPTRDKPIPTLKFEASREGLNDLRYLETLEYYLSKNPNGAEAAKVELAKMLDTFSLYNPKGIQSENFKVSPQVYERLRADLQNLILQVMESPQASR